MKHIDSAVFMIDFKINTQVQKDPMKPDGDAVNPDGILKGADEINWLNSPTDVVPSCLAKQHRQLDDASVGDDNLRPMTQQEQVFCLRYQNDETHHLS